MVDELILLGEKLALLAQKVSVDGRCKVKLLKGILNEGKLVYIYKLCQWVYKRVGQRQEERTVNLEMKVERAEKLTQR